MKKVKWKAHEANFFFSREKNAKRPKIRDELLHSFCLEDQMK